MLTYKIKQGEMRVEDTLVASGLYSGQPQYQNDPLSTNLKDMGPLPVGVYWIGEPRDTTQHGPMFIPLIPVTPGIQRLYNRGGFGIHGERVAPPPGLASNGCIIAPHDKREIISQHVGEFLVVLSGNW